jgi:hypothetical protein
LAHFISTGQSLLRPQTKLTRRRIVRVIPVACCANEKTYKRLWEDYAPALRPTHNPPTKMLNPFGKSEKPNRLAQ